MARASTAATLPGRDRFLPVISHQFRPCRAAQPHRLGLCSARSAVDQRFGARPRLDGTGDELQLHRVGCE